MSPYPGSPLLSSLFGRLASGPVFLLLLFFFLLLLFPLLALGDIRDSLVKAGVCARFSVLVFPDQSVTIVRGVLLLSGLRPSLDVQLFGFCCVPTPLVTEASR